MKRFLFSLFVMLTTTFFASAANMREISSVTSTPLTEIAASPESPTKVYVREVLIIVKYLDGSVDIYYERTTVIIND